jgi:DNA-binding NarL/FixJ family response regulator
MSLVENVAVADKPRLLLVDDHLLFMLGLRNLLREIAPHWSVDLVETADEAVHAVSAFRYDVVLLDWHLEGGNAADCLARLRRIGGETRVVMLSGDTRLAVVRQSIEGGAVGFIAKKHGAESMLAALDVVMSGGTWLPPDAAQGGSADTTLQSPPLAHLPGRLHRLTDRQRDVYRAAARGLPNKVIARELGIAESTVKTHLTVIYTVLGVRNRTQAAAYEASLRPARVD